MVQTFKNARFRPVGITKPGTRAPLTRVATAVPVKAPQWAPSLAVKSLLAQRPAEASSAMLADYMRGVNTRDTTVAKAMNNVIGHYMANEAKVLEATLTVEAARARIAKGLAEGKPLAGLDRARLPKTEGQAVDLLMKRLKLTRREKGVVAEGLKALARSAHLPPLRKSIGGDERINPNTHRTQMAVTDPGIDHLTMTLADPRMLNGAFVHVEIIDRSSPHQSPYSVPSAHMVGTLRLFLGDDAPLTVFFGRPNYMPSTLADAVPGMKITAAALKYNRETAINGLSLAARGLFDRGASEIKVTADGLSLDDVTQFGRDLHAKLRMSEGEYVSAAFNLNALLKDFNLIPADAPRISGAPTSEQRELMLKGALSAIEAAHKGGFKKVTLDSASMSPPSYPLIEYFGVDNLLRWVHDAHLRGLETYGSGGMRDYHFPILHLAGLDGVGVGFSIHEPPKPETPGIAGRMLPEKVLSALDARDRTEASAVGRATTLLRMLAARQARGDTTVLERALERKTFNFVRKVAREIDTQLEQLKLVRDNRLAQAENLAEPARKQEQNAAKEAFETGFKALITDHFFSGRNDTEAQDLLLAGKRVGIHL